jgi:hypothetical protein
MGHSSHIEGGVKTARGGGGGGSGFAKMKRKGQQSVENLTKMGKPSNSVEDLALQDLGILKTMDVVTYSDEHLAKVSH